MVRIMMPNGGRVLGYAALISFAVVSGVATGSVQASDTAARITELANEVRQAAKTLQNERPEVWQRALGDFDLAVRSNLLVWDRAPDTSGCDGSDGVVPHVCKKHRKPRWPQGGAGREYTIATIERRMETAECRDWAEFIQARLDDLYVEDSPEIRLVLKYYLIEPWNDWSLWDDEVLTSLREEFPEIHRFYAVEFLSQMKDREAIGAVAHMLKCVDVPEYLSKECKLRWSSLSDGRFEHVEFALHLAFNAQSPVVRYDSEIMLSRIVDNTNCSQRCQEFWREHVDSPIPLVRYIARENLGMELPYSSRAEMQHEYRKWLMVNDPDPARREWAKHRVEREEERRKNRRPLASDILKFLKYVAGSE